MVWQQRFLSPLCDWQAQYGRPHPSQLPLTVTTTHKTDTGHLCLQDTWYVQTEFEIKVQKIEVLQDSLIYWESCATCVLLVWFICKDRNTNKESNLIYHLPVLPQSVKPQVKCYDRLCLLCWHVLRERRGGVWCVLSDDRCGTNSEMHLVFVKLPFSLKWLLLTGDYAAVCTQQHSLCLV